MMIRYDDVFTRTGMHETNRTVKLGGSVADISIEGEEEQDDV